MFSLRSYKLLCLQKSNQIHVFWSTARKTEASQKLIVPWVQMQYYAKAELRILVHSQPCYLGTPLPSPISNQLLSYIT